MKITFFGAAGGVTGSKYLLQSHRARVLIDCGLFQGPRSLRQRNREPLPFDPSTLDAIVLTHGHIDHSGFLPVLVREGFRGRIHTSWATVDLCGILLPDSGRIQEEDARYADKKGYSTHRPAIPLYTEADARRTLTRFAGHEFEERFEIGDLSVRLRPAGHILGAAHAEISGPGGRILFSGDVGRQGDMLMHNPTPPEDCDWIVTESTYGNRDHEQANPLETIAEILSKTTKRGGLLLIPSFAVGRSQKLLYCLHEIFKRELCTEVAVYVNSPMATSVTNLYERFHKYHRMSKSHCAAVFDMPTFVRSVDESKALNARFIPSVIISASGMATAGRVLHHLKALLPDHRNTVLFPGFCASGTRGEHLVSGAREVRIHGQSIPVRADVHQLHMFSAHADRSELLTWLGGANVRPRKIFVTHGEPDAADALAEALESELGWDPHVARFEETIELS